MFYFLFQGYVWRCYQNWNIPISLIYILEIVLERTEPYEIQHVAILHVANEARLRKSVVQNLFRSHRMKVYKSFDEINSNSDRVGIVQGSFHQRNALLFLTTADGQCSCVAMFSVVYSLFKDINL